MELTQSENGALGGVYKNMAPDSSTVEERVIGSLGKGVPATLGFTVNFEVSQKNVTAFCGSFIVHVYDSWSREQKKCESRS